MRKLTYKDQVFTFEGCLSVQVEEKWVMPWRIDYQHLSFFPGLKERGADDGAGVRLCFVTNSIELTLFLEKPDFGMVLCLWVDGLFLQKAYIARDSNQVKFDPLPFGVKTVEIMLDHRYPFKLRDIGIDSGSEMAACSFSKKNWVLYGGSISQAKMIDSPARVWSALVAKRLNLNLINLGFKGFCTFDPMMACLIGELPVDFITVLLEHYPVESEVHYQLLASNIIGWTHLIREKHPEVPMAFITPLVDGPREMIEKVIFRSINIFREYGDKHIFQINGSDIYYLENDQYFDDSIQNVVADRFLDVIFIKTFC